MTETKLNEYRRKLLALDEELEASLTKEADTTQPVKPDRAIGRLTRQDAILAQQMALELKRRNEARLALIRRALERIDEGDYGCCLRCEDEISETRLDVRPEAPICIACAESRGL